MSATVILPRGHCVKLGLAALLLAQQALAQAPVEERRPAPDAVLDAQQKTAAAYRALTQAQYDAKLAEQDFLNAEAAYKAAQKQADASKQYLDAAKKKLDEARVRESAARKAYEQATNITDQQFRQQPSSK
jgi:hypothetical protein